MCNGHQTYLFENPDTQRMGRRAVACSELSHTAFPLSLCSASTQRLVPEFWAASLPAAVEYDLLTWKLCHTRNWVAPDSSNRKSDTSHVVFA